MKKTIFFIFLLKFTISFSQITPKTCETPKNEVIDLNSITSKCSIEKTKDDSEEEKSTLKISLYKTRKKTVSHIIRRNRKTNSIDSNNTLQKDISSLDSEIEFNNKIITRDIVKNSVLFNIVDEIPLFESCDNKDSVTNKKCFNKQISNHFEKHLHPEKISEDGFSGKVFIQFTITTHGKINDLLIKSSKSNPNLNEEITRIIEKLPILTPGKHQGIPVDVVYSLPLNFEIQ